LPDEAVLVFLLPPSMQALEERLRKRGTDSDDTVKRRLAHAPDEIRRMDEYDYVVVNDSIDAAQANLFAICRAEALRRTRLVDASGGAAVVDEFLRETARPFGPRHG
jgi:guanylate kinase